MEDITLKLTNCVSDTTQYDPNVSDTYDFTLTANDGCVFKDDERPYLELKRYGAANRGNFNIQPDKKTATIRMWIGESTAWVKITGVAYEGAAPVQKVQVSKNLSKCTANSDLPTEVEVGQNLSVTLTADEGFIFDKSKSTPNFSYQNENLDFTSQNLTISDDGSTATGSIVMGDWSMFTINGTAYTKPTPKPKVKVTTKLSNCTANSDLPTEVEVGQNLSVTLTANDGTKFDKDKTTPNFSYQDENLDFTSQNLTISEDGRTATGSIVMGDWRTFTINGEAYPVTVVGGKYGAVNVYLVTIDNLDAFSKKRYFRVTGTDPQTGASIYENVDLGDYVNKIIRIYTPIKASSTDVIRCGNYNTNISCFQPETDKITLDFGNITIPNNNKNNVDFESEINLFLPFLGFVNISSEYIGKTINLKYVINVITGNGSALISCDGVMFQVEEVEPKNNVLYLSQNTESKTIGSDDWNERLFYGIEPYLLVKWFNSVGDGLNNDRKSGKIGDFTGFSRFDDIEPISTTEMLTDEQKQIYNLLNSGVYVI